MSRVASLDLLRGLAALAVALPHFFVYTADGTRACETVSVLAVEIFFVLSGFVLAPQILLCVERGGFAILLRFLVRRWMRTVPPYAVALVAISVLFQEMNTPDMWRYLFYVQNLWRQFNTNDYYSVAWSLSIEEWFYVGFPALLLLVRMLAPGGVKRSIAAALAVIAAVAVLRGTAADYNDWGPEVRRVVVFRIDSIVYGFLLFVLIGRLGFSRSAVVSFVLLALAAIIGFKTITLIAETSNPAAKFAFPFVAAAFGMLAVTFFRALAPAIDRFPALRRLSLFFGRISYSVYLFHMHALYLVREGFAGMPEPAQFAIYLAATTAFASLFYHFFERPILAARPRLEPLAGPLDEAMPQAGG
jgi:peptidoglycan/LPS O-acetylase OafA/YrhL